MLRRYVAACIITVLALACSKHDTRDESVLYGTWVDSNNPGDTLRFVRENNQNVMQIIQTSGPTPYSELVYTYVEGKLGLLLIGASQPNKTINSFTWTQQNKSFDMEGYELYPLLSTVTHLTYKKVD
jgi:hypothetical protein